MASVNDHEIRIVKLEKNSNVNFIDKDSDIDSIFNENLYNKEEFNSLARENDLFSISNMNNINNSIESKIPISEEFSEDSLNNLLFYNDENDINIYKNSYVLYNNEIKQLTNLSNVRDIFAASHASYVLTFDNKIYSWGYDKSGQYGDGDTTTKNKIHKAEVPEKPIKFMSVGGRNVFVVYEDNEIYCWGLNNHGCLGIGNTNQVNIPVKLNLNFSSPIKQLITNSYDSSTGMSAILLENGELYVCGNNNHYDLGLSHTDSLYYFTLNNYNFESKIKKIGIDAIYDHTNLIVLTENGDIFTTGYRGYGLCLDGKTYSSGVPYFNKATILPKNEKVIDFFISAGNLCILTINNKVYYYGYNRQGSLGIGNSDTVYTSFITHPILKNIVPINISGTTYKDNNGHHIGFSILSKDYNCYMSGSNLFNTNGYVGNNTYSCKINIDNKKIKKSTAGFDHRLFLTTDGEIYSFGINNNNETLNPNTQTPKKIPYDFNNEKFNNEIKYIKYIDINEDRLIDIIEGVK